MARSFEPRLRILEQLQGDDDRRRIQIEADAANSTGGVQKLAAGFTEQDRAFNPVEQARWSGAQRVAWAIRCAPDRAAPILQEYIA